MKLPGKLAIGFALTTTVYLIASLVGGVSAEGLLFGMAAFALLPIYLLTLGALLVGIAIGHWWLNNRQK